jgi:flagellar biosynthesis GTPase FlhF
VAALKDATLEAEAYYDEGFASDDEPDDPVALAAKKASGAASVAARAAAEVRRMSRAAGKAAARAEAAEWDDSDDGDDHDDDDDDEGGGGASTGNMGDCEIGLLVSNRMKGTTSPAVNAEIEEQETTAEKSEASLALVRKKEKKEKKARKEEKKEEKKQKKEEKREKKEKKETKKEKKEEKKTKKEEKKAKKERRKTPSMEVSTQTARAIVMLQAVIRRQLTRRAMRANASAQGMLLAMPGTAQGRSGNYEYDADGQVLIAEFDVVDGEWVMRHEPTEKRAWLKARGV